MSDSTWLEHVQSEDGQICGGCGNVWRVLRGLEIEQCPNCQDEAFDIYEVAEAMKTVP